MVVFIAPTYARGWRSNSSPVKGKFDVLITELRQDQSHLTLGQTQCVIVVDNVLLSHSIFPVTTGSGVPAVGHPSRFSIPSHCLQSANIPAISISTQVPGPLFDEEIELSQSFQPSGCLVRHIRLLDFKLALPVPKSNRHPYKSGLKWLTSSMAASSPRLVAQKLHWHSSRTDPMSRSGGHYTSRMWIAGRQLGIYHFDISYSQNENAQTG